MQDWPRVQSPDLIRTIYIDRQVAEQPLALNIRERLASSAVQILEVDDARDVLDLYKKEGRPFENDALLVYRFPGQFVSTCPGSDGVVCCQYFVINLGVGCLYDCHYCYLQNFMNLPLMTLFGNLDEMFAELDRKISGKGMHFRVGTGEYTDSLALDPITGLSALLVERFARIPNATLELKTKSSHVEELLSLDHRGRTVLSWSLNPQAIIDEVETGTASLEERLCAAERAQEAGYRLAFHFDPMVHHEGWEQNYHRLIDELLARIHPDRIAWISLGTFRHSPGQKEIMQRRFPDDRLTREEMVQGSDGKLRYFKTIRESMYASIRKKFHEHDPRLFLYLCMETRRMWQGIFGFAPDSAKRLDALFDERRRSLDAASSSLAP